VTVVGLARAGWRPAGAGGTRRPGGDGPVPRRTLADLADLEARGVRIETGGHHAASFLAADLIVISPGVPTDMALLAQARLQGIPVWGEVELASRLTAARFLGITGTNGKSTTTSLVGAMLDAAGFPVVVGNIGRRSARWSPPSALRTGWWRSCRASSWRRS
jgi:UDP-N-acetylmuramoylalanine--D-glutamate ligase